MKVFYTTFSIALAILIANPTTNVQAVTQTTEIAQRRSRRTKKPVSLGLHTVFKVILKNGSSMWATLTVFNPQKKTVQITSKNGNSRAVKIEDIKSIMADKNSPVVNSDGKRRIIRGEDTAKAKQSTWSDVPLNQFQIKDGETNVDLSDVLSPRRLRGIRGVAAKSLYVIDEIEFNDSGNMTIKVTPIDQGINDTIVYNNLGEKGKSLKYYTKVLSLYRAIGNRLGEAATRNNIGNVYLNLEKKDKALKYYNLALSIYRAVGDKDGEATTMNSIVRAYSDVGEK